jgi:hypothetical protein
MVILRMFGMLGGFLGIAGSEAFGGVAMFLGRTVTACGCFGVLLGMVVGRGHENSPMF